MHKATKTKTTKVVAEKDGLQTTETDTSSSSGFYKKSGKSVYLIRFATAGGKRTDLTSINRRLRGRALDDRSEG